MSFSHEAFSTKSSQSEEKVAMMRSAEEGGADAEGRHQFFNKPLVIKTAQNTPAEVYNAASSFLRHPVCLSITLFAKTQLTNAQYYIQQ